MERIGLQEGYHITGHRLSASYSAAKIIWVRNHQPEIYARVYKFTNAKDFIVTRLTGRFVTDYSDASGTNLFDLQAWDGLTGSCKPPKSIAGCCLSCVLPLRLSVKFCRTPLAKPV